MNTDLMLIAAALTVVATGLLAPLMKRRDWKAGTIRGVACLIGALVGVGWYFLQEGQPLVSILEGGAAGAQATVLVNLIKDRVGRG